MSWNDSNNQRLGVHLLLPTLIQRHRFVVTDEGWRQMKWWGRDASLYLCGCGLAEALQAEAQHFHGGGVESEAAAAAAADGTPPTAALVAAQKRGKQELERRITEELSALLRESFSETTETTETTAAVAAAEADEVLVRVRGGGGMSDRGGASAAASSPRSGFGFAAGSGGSVVGCVVVGSDGDLAAATSALSCSRPLLSPFAIVTLSDEASLARVLRAVRRRNRRKHARAAAGRGGGDSHAGKGGSARGGGGGRGSAGKGAKGGVHGGSGGSGESLGIGTGRRGDGSGSGNGKESGENQGGAAVPAHSFSVGTSGGLRCTIECQVAEPDFAALPGLLASGASQRKFLKQQSSQELSSSKDGTSI